MRQRGKMRMATKAPTHKLLVGTGAGVTTSIVVGKQFGVVIVYFLAQALGHPLPDAVGTAIESIFEWVTGIGLGLLAGYYTPPGPNDYTVEDRGDRQSQPDGRVTP